MIIEAAHRFPSRPSRQYVHDGIILGEDRPGIPAWDAAADAIGERHAAARAIHDERQREVMREAFAKMRPGKGDLA